jgi:hypothetical protein
MLCRLVPFDVKNCLVVDAILFSNLHECEFASESYLANYIFYKSIRKPFPVALSFRSSRRRSQRLCMKNPGFDSGHGQTETLSGLLVREGSDRARASRAKIGDHPLWII